MSSYSEAPERSEQLIWFVLHTSAVPISCRNLTEHRRGNRETEYWIPRADLLVLISGPFFLRRVTLSPKRIYDALEPWGCSHSESTADTHVVVLWLCRLEFIWWLDHSHSVRNYRTRTIRPMDKLCENEINKVGLSQFAALIDA